MRRLILAAATAIAFALTSATAATAATPAPAPTPATSVRPVPAAAPGHSHTAATNTGQGVFVTDDGGQYAYALHGHAFNEQLTTLDYNEQQWNPNYQCMSEVIRGGTYDSCAIELVGTNPPLCANWASFTNTLYLNSCPKGDLNEQFLFQNDTHGVGHYWIYNIAASIASGGWNFSTSIASDGTYRPQFCDGCNVAEFTPYYAAYAEWYYEFPA